MAEVNGYERAYALMQEIWENFDQDLKDWFLKTNTIEMHHDLGRHIRNHARLWEDTWTPYLIDGVDHAYGHPDAVSARVLLRFQLNKLSEGLQ